MAQAITLFIVRLNETEVSTTVRHGLLLALVILTSTKPIVDLFSIAWQTKDLSIALRAAHEASCAFGLLVTTINADSDYLDALLRTGYLWSAWLNVLLAAITWARALCRRAGSREIAIFGASLGVHTLVALAPGLVASARWFSWALF